MSEEFNFDDFDTSDLDEGLSNFDDSFESGIADFQGTEEQEVSDFESSNNNETDTKITKTAIIAIAVGFIVILVAFFGMKMLNTSSAKNSDRSTSSITTSNSNSTQQASNSANSNIVNPQVDMGSNNSIKKDKDWKSFDVSSDLTFSDKYVDSIFTVVSTKNYVKVANNDSELMVKTIVTGSLSGFTGTYELELPYYKGSQLLPGNNFKVEVQIGNFKENSVVGEIVY